MGVDARIARVFQQVAAAARTTRPDDRPGALYRAPAISPARALQVSGLDLFSAIFWASFPRSVSCHAAPADTNHERRRKRQVTPDARRVTALTRPRDVICAAHEALFGPDSEEEVFFGPRRSFKERYGKNAK